MFCHLCAIVHKFATPPDLLATNMVVEPLTYLLFQVAERLEPVTQSVANWRFTEVWRLGVQVET